jgi:N-acetylglutamate synthase-like GNAT family acetyltransferase
MVRAARPGDAQAAVEILRRSITQSCVDDHRDDPATLKAWLANKTVEHFMAWLGDGDRHCVVAALDGPLCGVAMLHRSGEVVLCYVSPEAQGRGVGQALNAALLSKAVQWQLSRLYLDSTLGARGFYERLG